MRYKIVLDLQVAWPWLRLELPVALSPAMAMAEDILHLEGGNTGLTLWFSGPWQVGKFVASWCSGPHPLGAIPLRLLQPRSQYIAIRPDDILAVQESHMASEGLDTFSVCPTCRGGLENTQRDVRSSKVWEQDEGSEVLLRAMSISP